MTARTVDGLSALAYALATPSSTDAELEIVCFDLGGEGARRACAALRDAGVAVADERGAAAASAALGASAAGARVFLVASGDATVSLARATRAAARSGLVVTGLVISHGDDVGAVLPLSDGSDLAALGAASADRWALSSPDEVRQWTRARLEQLSEGAAARSAIAAMDLRAVAMREVTAPSEPRDERPFAAVVAAPSAPARTLHPLREPAVEVESVLISCGAGEAARVAAEWLRGEGVRARAVSLRRSGPEALPALRAALAGARHALVHDCAPGSGLAWLVRAALEPGCALDELASGRAVDAVDFCEAIARVRDRRAALQAGSRALRVQLVGPPSTRAAAVRLALSALSLASITAWAERVEPTHALLTVDVGAAGAVGSSGWLVVVAGLPVQAPIEPALGASAMIVDAGLRSTLLSARGDGRDQAALVVAAALVELELRGQGPTIAALERSLGLGDGPDDPLAWVQVRARADHLHSLR